jgi:hypothetical protein
LNWSSWDMVGKTFFLYLKALGCLWTLFRNTNLERPSLEGILFLNNKYQLNFFMLESYNYQQWFYQLPFKTLLTVHDITYILTISLNRQHTQKKKSLLISHLCFGAFLLLVRGKFSCQSFPLLSPFVLVAFSYLIIFLFI